MLATGSVMALDSQIDTTTGTVKVRAQFDNADNALFPNQFVNAQLLVKTLHERGHGADAAIQRGAPGTYVYVVNADNTVVGAADHIGSDRRQPHGGRRIRACGRRHAWSSTAPTGCATAARQSAPASTASKSRRRPVRAGARRQQNRRKGGGRSQSRQGGGTGQ